MPRGLTHALSVMAMVLAGAIWSNAARANTVFDFDLTPIFGDAGGTGSITVDGTHGHDVTDLSITIDSTTYVFNPNDASATIKNGDLVKLEAADLTKHVAITLDFLGGIFLDFAHPREDTIFALTSIVDPPAPTPLPASWPMMLMALIGVGIFTLRRTSAASAASLGI
jgi:hypothetical protein